MPIIVNLDVMLARRKMRSKELAERIGITEQNVSLLKSGKVKGVRFDTLESICRVLDCQPGDILEYRATHDPESMSSTPIGDGSRFSDIAQRRSIAFMALRIAVGGFMHESTTFVDRRPPGTISPAPAPGPAPAKARPCSRPWTG